MTEDSFSTVGRAAIDDYLNWSSKPSWPLTHRAATACKFFRILNRKSPICWPVSHRRLPMNPSAGSSIHSNRQAILPPHTAMADN